MPQISSIRQMEIINRLTKSSATFAELKTHLYNCAQLSNTEIKFSLRTLQRDIKEISFWHDVEIFCSKKTNEYAIRPQESNQRNQLLFNSYQAVSLLKLNESLLQYVNFEKRVAQGSEHFQPLLQAIRDAKQISFLYSKWHENKALEKTCEPYLLKEHEGRWYLVAKDVTDEEDFIKIFGIDRISLLEVSKNTYDKENRKNAIELFKHCFGIFAPNAAKPTKVELSFYKSQKPYLETKPLHASQKVIKESEDGIIIQLTLFITYDFIKHLLSYGDDVEVLKPALLVKTMKLHYENALKYY